MRPIVGIQRFYGAPREVVRLTIPVANRLLQRWNDEQGARVCRQLLVLEIASDVETPLAQDKGLLA